MTTISPLSGSGGVPRKPGTDDAATAQNLVLRLNLSPKTEGKLKAADDLRSFLNSLSFDLSKPSDKLRFQQVQNELGKIKDGSIRSEMLDILSKKAGI